MGCESEMGDLRSWCGVHTFGPVPDPGQEVYFEGLNRSTHLEALESV